MIQEIITHLRQKTKYSYYFHSADVSEAPCVVYEMNSPASDGIKENARLTLQIITPGTGENSIVKSLEIQKDINNNILTKGDNKLTNNIISVVQNGGGLIPNKTTNTLHNILYYNITYK